MLKISTMSIVCALLLGIVGVSLYILSSQQNTSLPISSTTKTNTTVLASSTPSEQTDEWRTYTNTEYGFAFKYPNYYLPFQGTVPAINQGGIYLEKAAQGGLQVGYKTKISALVSVVAESQYKNVGEFRVNVYDLNSYTIANVPAGIEFGFDLDKNQWWQKRIAGTEFIKSVAVLPQVKVGNSLVGYKIGIGDAGEGFEYALIPVLSRKIMVEILYYHGIGATQGAPIDTILSTFSII